LNATANVTVTATVTSSKLTIAAATASSVENAGTPASAAIDNNAGTRWSSAFSDPQWITFDLGTAKNVTGVVFMWEAAAGKTYKVQASNDAAFGGTPLDLSSVTATNCAGRTDSLVVSSGGAYRYVRMLGATRCTGYGYSIWEARIYGF
jgi:beta-glucosidase